MYDDNSFNKIGITKMFKGVRDFFYALKKEDYSNKSFAPFM